MKRIFTILSTVFLVLTSSAQTDVYSVCGDLWKDKLWVVENTSTDMMLVDGLYTYTEKNITLSAKTYSYKVVVNHSWEKEAYPIGTVAEIVINKAGVYDITFSFNPQTKAVNAAAVEISSNRTLYLNTTPWWWDTDDYYAIISNGESVETALKMEKVLEYIYKVEVGTQYKDIIFVRHSAETDGFDKSKIIDLTFKSTIPSANFNLCTIKLPTTQIYNDSSVVSWSEYDEAMYEKYYSFGTCGGKLNYYICRNKVLEITGTGDMDDYNISFGAFGGWAEWGEPWGNEIDSIHVDEGVTKIGTYAFEDISISHFVIPSTVLYVGGNAISGKYLKSLTCKAIIPPLVNPINDYPEKKYVHFCQNVDFSIPLYVPAASVKAYQSADYWKDFINILPIEGGEQPGDEPQSPYDEDKEKLKQVQPTAVDLGLPGGNRWSDISIGAIVPEERGNFYQWGCTTSILREGWDIYCHGTKNALTKYCTQSVYGAVDNLTQLLSEDDAALQTWGNGWRMPNKDEAQELWDYCTRQEETVNGVAGVRFIGPNGNSVFFPFTGWLDEQGVLQNDEPSGRYWTSTLYEQNNNGAYAISINDTLTGVLSGAQNRHYGRCIRGVLPARNCAVKNEYNITLKQGDTFTFSGRTVIPAVGEHDYSVTLISKSGCDSTIVWHVTVTGDPQQQYFSVIVIPNSNYLGIVTGTGSYEYGANITITATAKKGAKFVKWSDGNLLAQRSVQVLGSITYTAVFAAIPSPSPNIDNGNYRDYDTPADVINPFGEAEEQRQNKQNSMLYRTTDSPNTPAVKIIINGQIYILKDNQLYTITGMPVKR